jgi:hypothetical protein
VLAFAYASQSFLDQDSNMLCFANLLVLEPPLSFVNTRIDPFKEEEFNSGSIPHERSHHEDDAYVACKIRME